ncbi:MAG: DinB family protein [Gemmatimonadales bacterium]
MKFPIKSLVILACVAAPLQAQGTDVGVPAVRSLWQQLSGYVLASAEDMPEAKYAFKPTPEVRSFGELIGHVAGSQNMFCAAALGEKEPAEDAVEKAATSKAALIAAMKASIAYCTKAYAQTDNASRAAITLFGQKRNRMYALAMNATHDGEHYGNLITYLRMNGLVPPSSKGM